MSSFALKIPRVHAGDSLSVLGTIFFIVSSISQLYEINCARGYVGLS